MINVGIDWANDHHDICIVNDQGKLIEKFRIDHDAAGFEKLSKKISQIEKDKKNVVICIERPNGLLVEYLLDLGYSIYPVNPMAAERVRDRYKVTKVKDDKLDAWALANFVRTDLEMLRLLKPSSEEIRRLKVLVRDRKSIVYTNTRTLNQLISSLKSYYPRSLELFSHNSEIFLHFIVEYPTPKKATKVTLTKFKNFLKKHAYPVPHKIDMLFEKLKEPMIPVEDWIIESKAVYTSSLVDQLKMLRKQIKVFDNEISNLVNAHSSHEIFESLPGCGSVLQSELMINFGDNKEVFSSYKNVQQQAGTAPITKQSGTYKVVKFRRACSHPFRDTMHSFAFSSITKSLWAKRYYYDKRNKGYSHSHALRCLANVWIKIIFKLWKDNILYDENVRLAGLMKHDLNQPCIAIA